MKKNLIIIITLIYPSLVYSNNHLLEIKTLFNHNTINSYNSIFKYQQSKGFGFSYLYNFNNLYLGLDFNQNNTSTTLTFKNQDNYFDLIYFNNNEYSINIKYNFYTIDNIKLLIGMNLGFTHPHSNLKATISNTGYTEEIIPISKNYEEDDIIPNVNILNNIESIENYFENLCPADKNNITTISKKVAYDSYNQQFIVLEPFTCNSYENNTIEYQYYSKYQDKIVINNNFFTQLVIQFLYQFNNYVSTSIFANITNYQDFNISKTYNNNINFNTNIYATNYTIGGSIIINTSKINYNIIYNSIKDINN